MQKYIIPQRRHSAAISDSFAVLDEHLSSPAATRPPAARLRLALQDRTNIPTNFFLPPAVRKESAQPGGLACVRLCSVPALRPGSASSLHGTVRGPSCTGLHSIPAAMQCLHRLQPCL